jgi:hypothetical protein
MKMLSIDCLIKVQKFDEDALFNKGSNLNIDGVCQLSTLRILRIYINFAQEPIYLFLR